MAPPPKKLSKKRVCGFFRPDGTVVSETEVRNAIVAAAVTERSTWLAGTTLQKEDEPARFGDLVRYWLAGSKGDIRPDRLVAAQQAATTSGIPYGKLVDATLAGAVGRFKVQSGKADTALLDVYAAWDPIDIAVPILTTATSNLKTAEADVRAAQAGVRTATTNVKKLEAQVKAKAAPQSDLDTAKTALASARTALTSAETRFGTARDAHDDAKKRYQDAVKARDRARDTHRKAVSARDKLKGDAQKIAARKRREVRAKVVAAAPSGSVSGLDGAIETALLRAHDFSSDIDAWSAVFVGACVRAAAIKLKLEGVVAGRHRGQDGLLAVSARHAEYIIAARGRKTGKQGTYLAFDPKVPIIQKGDIIATDRVDEIRTPIKLPDLAGRRTLHCDIVTEVNLRAAQPYAETVGGNVTHTARRRRYPLTSAGKLIMSPAQLYLQEDDKGTFGAFSALTTTPSVLKPRSTGRIFAVLSLVEGCDMVDDSEIQTEVSPSVSWRDPTGEGTFMKALENLESPFFDGEVLPVEREEPDWVTREDSLVEARDEFLEEGGDYESDLSYEAESPAYEDESMQDYSVGVKSEWESALLEAERDEESYQREEPDTLLEREDGELGPADSIDEAAAQCLFPQPVRDRVEPLLDAAAARAASAWNAARHPKVSGVSAAALLARLERYVHRSAIESAMQKSAGLKSLTGDAGTVLAVVAHQFQQKIYTAAKPYHDGKIGEGTLDALGFVRHRGDGLNAVDALNVRFHVKGRSKAFQRLQQVYRTDRAAFEQLGTDATPQNWYRLFVNAPFLGRPFKNGIHVELMRRLRQAEKWLLSQSSYKQMSPVGIGAAMNIDEDHHGGRTTANNSMHTLGLAVDIRYLKNPWVAGQHNNEGKLNETRNTAFKTVTRNVSRLLSGTDEVLTTAWLHGLASDPAGTSASAYDEIEKRHTSLQAYLSLQNDSDALKTTIARRRQGPKPELVLKPRETDEAAAARWRKTIKDDRKRLQLAFGSTRAPEAGFMNLERALVCALRDRACLAWGAIDLGAIASGDMMHFDCRATGIGWKLSLERQRTVGPNHPCVKATAATEAEAEDLETTPTPAVRSTVVSFLGGRLWSFTSSTLPMKIGVFCPKVLTSPKSVDVLVFVHGLLDVCKPEPKTTDELIKNKPFELAKHVDASGREIVLVAPFMDWPNLKTNGLKYEACFRDNMHLLGTPAKLNGVVREALVEVGRVFGIAPPSIQNLILSGHSKAYEFFDPLAMAHWDPEMSKGCLARLSEVWALDTTYSCPTDLWLCWLASKPNLKMQIFYGQLKSTKSCGLQFAWAARKTGKRMQVFSVTDGHCAVPAIRLPKLLNPASTSAKPKTKKELEEEDFEPQEALSDEHEMESAEYKTDEAETEPLEGAEWESPADEPLEASDEELEADAAGHERDRSPEVSEAEDEHEDDDKA